MLAAILDWACRNLFRRYRREMFYSSRNGAGEDRIPKVTSSTCCSPHYAPVIFLWAEDREFPPSAFVMCYHWHASSFLPPHLFGLCLRRLSSRGRGHFFWSRRGVPRLLNEADFPG